MDSRLNVKQLNVELRLAAKKAKEEARAQQTDRRAQEAETKHLQTAALATVLELVNRLMSKEE